jgi:alpha-tubulin suppressor-like RCC1 family protein
VTNLAKRALTFSAVAVCGVLVAACSSSPKTPSTSLKSTSTTTTTAPTTTSTTAAPVTTVPESSTAQHWGRFGDDKTPNLSFVDSPTAFTLPGPIVQVGSSNSTDYALLANGTVFAWGIGDFGQLGNGGTSDSFTTPVQVQFPAGVSIAKLATDAMPYDTAMAIDTAGHVWGWGYNSDGQLCLGNTAQQLTPVRLPFTGVTAVAGAGDHGLYDANGTVYACGSNGSGDLGDGSQVPSSTPVQVKVLPVGQVSVLVASWENSGALLQNGTYFDWGYNAGGQLGQGTAGTASSVPVMVTLPTSVAQVALGGSNQSNGQSLVMLSDGAIMAWGDDQAQQLGDHGSGTHPIPLAISPPTGVTYKVLAIGGGTSYAITTSGDVYSWGAGFAGMIGNGSSVKVGKPTMVESGISHISATAANVVTS